MSTKYSRRIRDFGVSAASPPPALWGGAMSSLQDFGGGVDDDPSPEDEVKINLSQWFENHGATVYWEKRPSYGYGVFRTKTTERPDLLVDGEYHTFAVEVKIPDGAGDIYSGANQTYRYWHRYCMEDVDEFYKVDGDEKDITAFLVATGFSPDGRLSQRYDTQSDVRPLPIHDDRRLEYFDPPIHFLPDWEFGVSETVTRMLWRLAGSDNENRDYDAAVGIGSMLSTRLDGGQPDIPEQDDPGPFDRKKMPEPRALYQSYDDESGGGANCQNWREL